MRPAIANEIHTHSGSLKGIFYKVDKVLKMAIFEILRIGV